VAAQICTRCKRGSLLLVGQAGRKVRIDGATVDVPRNFLIPTCDHCGVEQLDQEWRASLAVAAANARVAALRSVGTEEMEIVAAPVAALAVGELVAGTYEIVGVLGAGAMGTVYEAHDRALNRRVALKVAPSPDPGFSLRKEAQALAAIRHPSMVAVHALARHRGVECLVMELIRGTTLHDHIHKQLRTGKPFTIAEVLDTLLGIADGLAAVHASGISHRDIKPANIMLAPGNRTVLMDFALFTPELDAGAGHLVDLYALGVIAYELLSGHPPDRGANALETPGMQARSPIAEIAAERSDVPAGLSRLVYELLAKAPADRPQGIDDVLGRLRALRSRLERGRVRGRFTVLIVDDDRDFAETMRAIVRAAVPDVDVSVARDGEAALASMAKRVPTVMLLDLNMPRMNGLELCMALRGTGLAAECEIISVNGAVTSKDRELLMRLGVRQSLTKTPSLSRTIVELVKTSRRRWLTAEAS
jgi:CheY-like chemotaxis protein